MIGISFIHSPVPHFGHCLWQQQTAADAFNVLQSELNIILFLSHSMQLTLKVSITFTKDLYFLFGSLVSPPCNNRMETPHFSIWMHHQEGFPDLSETKTSVGVCFIMMHYLCWGCLKSLWVDYGCVLKWTESKDALEGRKDCVTPLARFFEVYPAHWHRWWYTLRMFNNKQCQE